MYKLSFALKQHTPLIHFQHDQEGATLRATEVKPKLDRFIINRLGGTDACRTTHPEWFRNSEHPALDYKMRIDFMGELKHASLLDIWVETKDGKKKIKEKSLPGFFGNMMKPDEFENKTKEPKKVSFYDKVDVTIITPHVELRKHLDKLKSEFFFLNNFGTRQSKGFGSFYLAGENPEKQPRRLFYKTFTIEAGNFVELFQKIDYFYKSLRSGINIKDRNGNDVFYIKSLLFWYCKHQYDVQWEKKTVKEHWFNNKLEDDIKKRKLTQNDQSAFNSENKKIIKDVLGLSTEESWLSYDKALIKKKHIRDNKTDFDKNSAERIDRFRSPITFRIFEEAEGTYRVYLLLNSDIPLLGQWFKYESKHKTPFPLQVIDNFDLEHYLNWVSQPANFSLNSYIEPLFQTRADSNGLIIYECLEEIFSQLQNH